ncbi:MAG: polyprenyl synthetase family protein [Anaerolineales bacterium]|nr:MAG: polyprenyl synthetase family protein [Anaerolineales bacterium]
MTIYHSAVELLLQQPQVAEWPLLQRALQQATGKPPVAWDFPIAGCVAAGAAQPQAIPAVAAITCAHMAILLIDDILDEDPRGEYNRIGAGRAANLAAGLFSLGQHVLETHPCPQPHLATAALNRMVGDTAFGQELDVQNDHSEESYWAVAHAKSSPYFGTALTLGGLYGGASQPLAEQLREFGALFGEVMQIHDDLNDCLAEPANVDWLQGRAPLPLLFAELVPHPQRERFVALRSQVTQPDALREAQSILVSSGAISYCVNELILRHRRLQAMLDTMPAAEPALLQQILDHAIAPVEHLFASVAAQP